MSFILTTAPWSLSSNSISNYILFNFDIGKSSHFTHRYSNGDSEISDFIGFCEVNENITVLGSKLLKCAHHAHIPSDLCLLTDINRLVLMDYDINRVSITNCNKDNDEQKWVFGLIHDTQSIFISDSALPSSANITQRMVKLSVGKVVHFDLDMFLSDRARGAVVHQSLTQAESKDSSSGRLRYRHIVESCRFIGLALTAPVPTSSFVSSSEDNGRNSGDSDGWLDAVAFTVQSDSPEQLLSPAWSADHWLDLCGLHSTVVTAHTWAVGVSESDYTAVHDVSRPHTASLESESVCNVRSVTGGPAAVANSAVETETNIIPPIVCLEDLLSSQLLVPPIVTVPSAAGTTTTLTGDNTTGSPTSGHSDHHPLLFVSSLGVSNLDTGDANNGSDTALDCSNTSEQVAASISHFLELVAVLAAFQNTGPRSDRNSANSKEGGAPPRQLFVRSYLTPLFNERLGESEVRARIGAQYQGHQQVLTDKCESSVSVSRALLSLLLVHTSDSAEDSGAGVWRDNLSDLGCALKNTVVAHQQIAAQHALWSYFYRSEGDFHSVRDLCGSVVAGESYLCSHLPDSANDLVRTFRSLLSTERVTASADRVAARYTVTMEKNVAEELLSRTRLDTANEQQRLSARVIRQHKAPPAVTIVADGVALVFVFVLPQHESIAQQAVEVWQRDCMAATPPSTCHLFVRYLVVPVATPSEQQNSVDISRSSSASGINSSSNVTNTEDLRRKPSLRVVLRKLSALISDLVTSRDVVFCLVGVEALLSFPPPAAPGTESAGVIPPIVYGGTGDFRLAAPIVVSCGPRSDVEVNSLSSTVTASRSSSCQPNYHAIVGVGVNLLSALSALTSHPRYLYASDGDLLQLLGDVLGTRADVHFDTQRNAFDSDLSSRILTSVKSHSRGSSTNARTRTASTSTSLLPFVQYVEEMAGVVTTHIDSAEGRHGAQERRYPDSIESNESEERFRQDLELLFSRYALGRSVPLHELHNTALIAEHYLGKISALPAHEVIDWSSDFSLSVDGHNTQQRRQCRVNYEALEALVTYAGQQALSQGRWFSVAFLMVSTIRQVRRCADYALFAESLGLKFIELGKYSKTFNNKISRQQYRHTATLLELFRQEFLSAVRLSSGSLLDDRSAMSPEEAQVQNLCDGLILTAIGVAIPALYEQTADYPAVLRHMTTSLSAARYSDVQLRRNLWLSQRKSLAQLNARNGAAVESRRRVHFVTFASERTAELNNLELSAQLSGVYLKVLGVGQPYTTYSDKINAYHSFLFNINDDDGDRQQQEDDESEHYRCVSDDDIVVLLDAYDVLLLPQIASVGRVLSESPTPILFCAEAGIYPEFAGAFMYHRGHHSHSSGRGKDSSSGSSNVRRQYEHMTQKFLNSGCIAGRAGQMRDMFAYTRQLSLLVGDDQHILLRYMLTHPDQASLDTEHRLFLTTYKAATAVGTYELSADLRYTLTPNTALLSDLLSVGGEEATQTHSEHGRQREQGGRLEETWWTSSSVGVIHCNNKNNNEFYFRLSSQLRAHHHSHFSGPDASFLLNALHAIRDGELEAAGRALSRPEVLRNLSSQGGKNSMGDLLLEQLKAHVERD